MQYIEPSTEDLPRLLAEVMGWTEWERDCGGGGSRWQKPDGNIKGPFKPHLSHDHAHITVEECAKRGLGRDYICSLWLELEGPSSPFLCTYDAYETMALATPEKKSRAALRALTSNSTK